MKPSRRAKIPSDFIPVTIPYRIGFLTDRKNWKSLIVVVAITAIVIVLEILGPLESMESFILELTQKCGLSILHRWVPDEEQTLSKIKLVEITDADYKNWFDSQSPLSPEILLQLISSIRDDQPRVIGVDFDTRDAKWKSVGEPRCYIVTPHVIFPPPGAGDEFRKSLPYAYESEKGLNCFVAEAGPPIIWAQVPESHPENIDKDLLTAGNVLGGLYNNYDRMGIPSFPTYPDGVVRTYRGEFGVYESHAEGDTKTETYRRTDSLARAIAEIYCPALYVTKEEVMFRELRKELVPRKELTNNLNKAGSDSLVDHFLKKRCRDLKFPKVPSNKGNTENHTAEHEFFRSFGEKCEKQLGQNKADEQHAGEQNADKTIDEDLQDKIVLVGGAYEAARDTHRTPIGDLPGVELVAQAIYSDLTGGGIRIIGWWYGALLDLALGTFIVYLNYQLIRWPLLAFRCGIVVLVMIFVVCAVLVLIKWAWLNVVPVAVGVYLHQFWDHYHDKKIEQESIKQQHIDG
jgi:hypothetical protein